MAKRGVIGSILDVLAADASVAALITTFGRDERPAQKTMYPSLRIQLESTGDIEYTFPNNSTGTTVQFKTVVWYIAIEWFVVGAKACEDVYNAVEAVMERASTAAAVCSKVIAVRDGVEIRDEGGASMREHQQLDQDVQWTHEGRSRWSVRVCRGVTI